MYLKSIEVQGFKSFANKIKFQFHNGITGIVGPNGSGKSNVGDAVRWVLGEQSVKQLRGSNMQDVIFSGTENRKPMGFAMVAITLDNSDHQLPVAYDEVTVTRRLYRSGESEYLINGTICRLRDIKELFYDTGIGKEGYSIIGQGQIEKILNGKPEERRELFDEAAGIVKFKRRKMAAQKKLDEEHSDLTRISDILSELTRQLGPLERQSEKARVYLKKRDELKQNDIRMFTVENRRLDHQLKEVEEKIRISDEDIRQTEEQELCVKEEYERIRLEIEEQDRQIEEKRELLNQQKLQQQSLNGQIELLNEQIRSARQNEEHIAKRIESIEESLSSYAVELTEQSEAEGKNTEILADAIARQSAEEKILEELTLEITKIEAGIAAGQSELIQILNDRANTKANSQRYRTMIEQIQIRKAQLTQQILTSKTQQLQIDQVKEGFSQEYAAVSEEIAGMVHANEKLEQEINVVQAEIAIGSSHLEELNTEYHRLDSRLEALRNMTERYDGYGNSIRRVMERKSQVPGILGVVADLIRTDRKYETAMETALGGSIQNIVTDHEQTAKQMIQYLKQNKYGRATFLPLSAIRAKGGIGNENALYEPGAIGVASTLVDVDPEFENLVDFLLGKTLVVDHIDHAIAIARKYKQSIRIVTLDGDLMNPGGAMSGGAFKNSSNLLGRRSEMESLKGEIEEKKNEMQQTREKISELRLNRSTLREELVQRTEEMQKKYLEQNTVRMKISETESQKQQIESGREEINREISELDQQMEEISQDQGKIDSQISESKERETQLESNIRAFQEMLETKQTEESGLSEKVSTLKIETETLRQKKLFQKQTVERIRTEMSRLEQEKRDLKTGNSDSSEEIRAKQLQIAELTANIAASEELAGGLQTEIGSMQETRKVSNESQQEFFTRREALVTQKSALDKERIRLDNQKERISDYIDRQINYMWEEYEMTKSEVLSQIGEEELPELSELKSAVSRLKGEIKALGSVNVNAIEEYKEISERHTFLAGQHADLIEAEEALRKIIVELDEGMRKQFREKFGIMQREFEKSFKELFGGGKGSLELTEDEDILEAGIRIIAQPPGKKLVNMMQMSGGEKALTAIALLFAIQNMKPSPFCLLDEIEAALDENNVSRYANYLHKLTKNTQFIIITHRRGTMAVADRLYGITMQEKGISTQVSVNMVEGELDQ